MLMILTDRSCSSYIIAYEIQNQNISISELSLRFLYRTQVLDFNYTHQKIRRLLTHKQKDCRK